MRELRRKALLYWILAIAGAGLCIATNPPGWDLDVYRKAIHSFQQGHDPFQDEVAATRDYTRNLATEYGGGTSLYYVYSPVTLRIGSWAQHLRVARPLYWIAYSAALLAILLVAGSAITERDSRYTDLIPPASLFFPGLLASGIFLSGNVAILLYGLTYAAAALGWRRNRWLPFYAAVLLCSLFKLPMLALLAIPVFSARRQWIHSIATAAAALAIFAAQSIAFPTLFHHQLQAVDRLFSFNRDIGCSPAGLFAGVLFDRHLPYFPLAPLVFLAYSIPICILLHRLSRRYLAGSIPLSDWMPVLLVGTTLLSPRLLEYDVLPITIPLALIGVRSIQRLLHPGRAALLLGALLLAVNIFLSRLPPLQRSLHWKEAECVVLCVAFVAGALSLLRSTARDREQPSSGRHPAVNA